MFLRIKRILGIVGCMFVAGAAYGEQYSISYTQSVKSSWSFYEAVQKGDRTMRMSKQLTVSDYIVVGEGPFAQLSTSTKGRTNTDVIGINYPGYAHLEIVGKKGSKICYVLYEAMVDTDGDVPMIVSFEAEAEFIEGTWESYLAGGYIKVRLTEKGEEETVKSAQSSLRQILMVYREKVLNGKSISGVSVSNPIIDTVQLRGEKVYEGNLDRITSYGASFLLKGSIQVFTPEAK